VCSFNEGNFAGRIVQRLGEKSCLINAATGQTLSGRDLPNLIAGFAAGFLSAGLRPGDRVLIQCGLTPPTKSADKTTSGIRSLDRKPQHGLLTAF
jgi:hypothetical protein